MPRGRFTNLSKFFLPQGLAKQIIISSRGRVVFIQPNLYLEQPPRKAPAIAKQLRNWAAPPPEFLAIDFTGMVHARILAAVHASVVIHAFTTGIVRAGIIVIVHARTMAIVDACMTMLVHACLVVITKA